MSQTHVSIQRLHFDLFKTKTIIIFRKQVAHVSGDPMSKWTEFCQPGCFFSTWDKARGASLWRTLGSRQFHTPKAISSMHSPRQSFSIILQGEKCPHQPIQEPANPFYISSSLNCEAAKLFHACFHRHKAWVIFYAEPHLIYVFWLNRTMGNSLRAMKCFISFKKYVIKFNTALI